MAHFYGSVRGSRGAVSRLGGKPSGIHAEARGWNLGVSVRGRVDEDGNDTFDIYRTSGSRATSYPVLIATVTEGKLTEFIKEKE